MIAAFMTSSPKHVSAICFIFESAMNEVCSATNCFVAPQFCTSIFVIVPEFATLKGQCFMSSCTASSLKLCPIRRFISNTIVGVRDSLVLCGFADEAFLICEGHTTRHCVVALIVGYDSHPAAFKNTNAGEG
uniref:NAD-specific glutamate dehydrogenase n=1 Tax=Echinococcus granulosus TaxID=6210 RepID=A0A068WUW4_ECHGR|nr:NAD-specific glutamate dehydrogenase [Echinococcus granulosus]